MSARAMEGRERRPPWLSTEQLYLYGPTIALVVAGIAIAFFLDYVRSEVAAAQRATP